MENQKVYSVGHAVVEKNLKSISKFIKNGLILLVPFSYSAAEFNIERFSII